MDGPEPANWMISTASRALAYGTPLLLGGLGEVCAEKSGVINLGVEGMMLLGAIAGFATAQTTGSPWLGLAAAAGAGALAALPHACASITLRGNQYVSGLALATLGIGLSGLFGRGWEGAPLATPLPDLAFPALAGLPGIGPVLFAGQSPLTYLALALALLLWFLFYRTRAGLAIRTVGECPAAADAQGVNVAAVRYACTLAGGAFAGVAGGFLSVAYRPSWTEGMTGGMGWIVLAIAVFSGCDPLKAAGGAFLFGALYHLSYRWQDRLAPELLKMLPYLGVIVVLTGAALGRRRRSAMPAALGIPYVRGAR